MISEHLLPDLNKHILCRKKQLEQLTALLDPDVPSPAALVLHGPEATGKTFTITAILTLLATPHAIIKSRECVTGRHLFERTILAIRSQLRESGESSTIDGRCENLSVLTVRLQQMLAQFQKFVIVFDGIDRQREAPPTLLQGLARLGEIIPSLTAVFIVTNPRPRFLSLSGLPHIYFPPYNRQEALTVLSLDPPPIFSADILSEATEERLQECAADDAWLWPRFCGAVYDSLGKTATRSIPSLRSICESLWPKFVEHIRNGSYGTRDFSRLMVRTRTLFQSDDSLRTNLLSSTTSQQQQPTTLSTPSSSTRKPASSAANSSHLPYYSKYLLIAAYLASYNPPRSDQTFFSKSSEASKKRKRKSAASRQASNNNTPSRGGGGAGGGAPNTPSGQVTTLTSNYAKNPSGSLKGHRKLARKLLGPQPFVLERWMAVFAAIVPMGIPRGAADLLTQVATLAALRMVVKLGGGSGGGAGEGGGLLDAGAKWRVNVGWEYVRTLARGLRFDVEDYVAE